MKELYRFVEGPNVWTYTSADIGTLHAAPDTSLEYYAPVTIGRDEFESRNELSKANLTITLPIDDTLAVRLMSSILDNVITLTVFDNLDYVTINTIWKGRLASVKPESSSVKLVFESVATSLKRYGLRMKYQRSCPHVLYGRGCNLDKDDFEELGEILSIASNGVDLVVETVAPWDPPRFIGGMLKVNATSLMRFIVGQGPAGGVIGAIETPVTLFRPIEGLTVGDSVSLYPGCDRSKETCDNVFDNLNNNGSFPFIPLFNPFRKSII